MSQLLSTSVSQKIDSSRAGDPILIAQRSGLSRAATDSQENAIMRRRRSIALSTEVGADQVIVLNWSDMSQARITEWQ